MVPYSWYSIYAGWHKLGRIAGTSSWAARVLTHRRQAHRASKEHKKVNSGTEMGKDQENLLAKCLYQASDGTESISVLSFPRELHHRVNTTCIAALGHLAGQRLSSKARRLFHPHMKPKANKEHWGTHNSSPSLQVGCSWDCDPQFLGSPVWNYRNYNLPTQLSIDT